MKHLLLLLFLIISTLELKAQLPLPDFEVSILTETKVRIYWKNNFDNCSQITIQKSFDSIRHFKTIFSSLSPELLENAYVDNDYLPQLKTFYRILYVYNEGNYAFTISKAPENKKDKKYSDIKINQVETINKLNRLITIYKPITSSKDSSLINKNQNTQKEVNKGESTQNKLHLLDSIIASPLASKKLFIIYKRTTDSLFKIIDEKLFSKFKDSIISKTKDTLYAYENDIIIWKPFIPDPAWQPSEYVYTALKGYLIIDLPLTTKHKYKLIIYNEANQEIMRLKQIKNPKLMLEKSNFIKAGWYNFELFEDDKLKEKNKFKILADF